MPEMKELVLKYKPDIFWSDGDGSVSSDYWESTKFIAWCVIIIQKLQSQCQCVKDDQYVVYVSSFV